MKGIYRAIFLRASGTATLIALIIKDYAKREKRETRRWSWATTGSRFLSVIRGRWLRSTCTRTETIWHRPDENSPPNLERSVLRARKLVGPGSLSWRWNEIMRVVTGRSSSHAASENVKPLHVKRKGSFLIGYCVKISSVELAVELL